MIGRDNRQHCSKSGIDGEPPNLADRFTGSAENGIPIDRNTDMLMRTEIRPEAVRHQGLPQRSAGPTYATPLPAVKLPGYITSYRQHQGIYQEGDEAKYFYTVVSGCIATYKALENGRRQITAFHTPGDVLGLQTRGAHTLSAEASAKSNLLLIKQSALVALARRDKDVADQLWTLTAAELERAQNHIRLFALPSQQRVAGFLVDMAHRVSADDEVELPMGRRDIADYLGLTLETVSRSFMKLARLDVIKIRGPRRIMLRNYPTLICLSG
jgi:CRP/FNR family nitrogen fixation transcriptional regulator